MKLAQRLEQEVLINAALSKAKEAERRNYTGASKRMSHEHLARYIALSFKNVRAIRSADEYSNRTYNRVRQIIGLIDHVFVRYPVPLFLYRTMLTYEGIEAVFNTPVPPESYRRRQPPEWSFRDWFFAVAKGESFAKVAKDLFTRKEAHWFLKAPDHNTIGQNVLWAKAAAAGLPIAACDYLADRLDQVTLTHLGTRLPDLFRFYSDAWPQMRGYDKDEITDFVRAAVQAQTFSFKGRTFGSMRKLCQEWHRGIYSGEVREYRTWANALPAWSTRHKNIVVRADELTNNRSLADEGKKQRHCVYTYTSQCLQGTCAIVSLRWFAVASADEEPTLVLERITIEVRLAKREIVQIRGRQNRSATDEEMRIVRMWAGESGLTIKEYAN